jgi:signal transduction histidine kinase/DNA-binding response OmpR family regulator
MGASMSEPGLRNKNGIPVVDAILSVIAPYLLIIGTLYLIAPHLFSIRNYPYLLDVSLVFGIFHIACGSLLLWVRLSTNRVHPLVIAALIGEVAVLLISAGFMTKGAYWLGLFGNVVLAALALLGVVELMRAWPPRPVRPPLIAEPLEWATAVFAIASAGVLLLHRFGQVEFSDDRMAIDALWPIAAGLIALAPLDLLITHRPNLVSRKSRRIVRGCYAGALLILSIGFCLELIWTTGVLLGLFGLRFFAPRISGAMRSPFGARLFAGVDDTHRQLAMVAAFALVLSMITMAAALTTVEARRLHRAAETGTAHTSAMIATDIDELLGDRSRTLAASADTPSVEAMDADQALATLAAIQANYPDFLDIKLINPAGTVLVSTGNVPDELSATQTAAMTSMESGQPVMAGIVLLPDDSQAVLIVQPVTLDKNGAIAGALAGFISQQEIEDLGRTNSVPGGNAVVMDENGTLVSSVNNEPGPNPPPADIAEISQQSAGSAWDDPSIRYGDLPYIVGTAGVQSTGWHVVSALQEVDAMAPARKIEWLALGLLAGSLVGLLIMILVLPAIVTRPVRALLGPVAAIGEGDYDATLPGPVRGPMGDLIMAIERMRDDLRKREAELQRTNAQLAQADRLKRDFLSTMSHELRTPLNGIIGYAHLLLDGMDGDLRADQRADIEQITRSADHLLDLISDVLDVSRIEAGHIVISKEALSPLPIVNAAVDAVRPQAQEKGLVLSIDAPRSAPPIVVDAIRLRQMLLNLLSNAVKFTEMGSVLVRVRTKETHLEIVVSDTGIGIPAHAQETVFDEFRQVDEGSARRFGGTGLGLTIARRLARLQNGDITLLSLPGVGSVFTLILPIDGGSNVPTPKAPGAAPLVTLPERREDQKLVMLVSPNIDMHAMTARAAELDGDQLVTLESGLALLDLASRLTPDVVLIDASTDRDLDSWQILKGLRAMPDLEQPTIAVLANAEGRSLARTFRADALLLKPVDATTLRETIGRRGQPDSAEVLVVDDDPQMRDLFVRILRSGGYLAGAVASGNDALEAIRRHKPDLVVLDLMMPDNDGFFVLEQIRRIYDASELPVLVASALDLDIEEQGWIERSGASLFEKGSARPAMVLDRVREMIQEPARVKPGKHPDEAGSLPENG